MATYQVNFYDYDPVGIIPTGTGSTFIWAGPATADGTAIITDTETGIEEFTLDDDSAGGETATADVTVGGVTSTASNVDAERTWTLRDTVTGQTFQVIEFDVENGAAAGDYTLSEVPLVPGRTYEVLDHDSNPNVLTGDPVFSAQDYTDQIVDGTAGDDTIDGSYAGDPQGDVTDGGDGTGVGGNADLIHAGAGNDSVSAGLEADTVYGGSGDDTILGGDGNDTIWGDSDPRETGTVGGSNTVGSTFTVIGLGSAADVDPTETNGISENAADLIGTYGTSDDPLYNQILSAETFDTNLDGNLGDNDNGATPEDIVIGGVTYQIDSALVYDATVTFTDGSSGIFTAVVFQTTTGELFLAPELTNNADNALLTSAPIESVTLTGVNIDDTFLAANRLDADWQLGVGVAGDDSIEGGLGDDVIYAEGGADTVDGGDGADLIYGDMAPAAAGTESLSWSLEGLDGDDISAGITQNTGTMDVSVSFTDLGDNNPTFTVETTDTNYVAGGEPYDANSSLLLFANGDGISSLTTIDFAAVAGGGMTDEVQNVSFRINDVDWGAANHRDILTINAFDADGNPVAVTLTPGGGQSVAGNTVTSDDTSTSSADLAGSILVEIAGPVQSIEITYENGLTVTQGVNVTDIYFDTIPADMSASADSLSGGAGDDTILGQDGDDTIDGGTGADDLTGGTGDDVFQLGDGFGDDTIVGGEAGETTGDTIDASGITTGGVAVSVTGEAGSVTQGADSAGFSEIENFVLTDQDDTFEAFGGSDVNVDGGGGNDTIREGNGNNTLAGGDGDDIFEVGFGTSTIDGGAGSDTLSVALADDAVSVTFDGTGSGTYNDLTDADGGIFTGVEGVQGSTAADIVDASADAGGVNVSGGGGADTITGGSGADTLTGGDGNDTIDGGDGADQIDGGTGDDTINGGIGFDTIDAGDGDDLIDGGSGSASINAGIGNDTVQGGFGNDTVLGGDGNDSITDSGGVTSFDSIDGGAGNDTISAGLGDDTLIGGDGDDTLEGGAGADQIDGGAGDDLLDYSASNAGVTIDLSTMSATGGHATGDTIAAVDNVLGSAFDDSLTGYDGTFDDTISNELYGGDGNDTISGLGGDDLLDGGSGNDILIGGIGIDTLFGGLGDDEMYLAEGDIADGGDGDDLFVLGDLGEAGSSTITIVGGEGGETTGDTLQLTPDVTPADITFTNTDDAAGGLSGTFSLADGTIVNFSEIENIICFTPGARILTPFGERAIETLKPGDLVITRDHGPQPIRWIGHRTVEGRGKFAPIAVNSTVMDGARRPLLVSPQHRLLFTGYKAQLLFGESEVLVAAKHLVDGRDVRVAEREKVTYFHMMLDRHEVIYAEGAATESFHAGDLGVAAISEQSREEMFRVFPELRSNVGAYGDTARLCLKGHEARLLVERRAPLVAAA